MYLDNNDFVSWMEKLSTKLNDIGKDLKSFTQTKDILEEDEKIMDNQDLAFLLKVSYRTLQRYRTSGKLPYFSIGHKTYYRINDVRNFVREHMDLGTYKSFEEKHPKDKTQNGASEKFDAK